LAWRLCQYLVQCQREVELVSDFLEAIVEFPTVIFTVIAAASLAFWTISTLLGAGLDLGDSDGEFGDANGDGFLAGFLSFAGLASLPFIVSIALVSIFGWFTSLVLMQIVGSRTTWVLVSLGVIVFALSCAVALFISALLARPLSKILIPGVPQRRGDFVGRPCVIRTETVTDSFGQAEVVDPEGSTLLIQVRCKKKNSLRSGQGAIIWSLDDDAGIFQVTPEDK
jgi:hypothetical protein